MEDNRRINIDYVAVIREDGNLFKLDYIDIKKPESLLSELKAILENPECTLLDLQSRMCDFYEEDRRRNISYLDNCYYSNTHTTGYVSFPKIYSPDELLQVSEETLKKRKKDYYHQCLNFITAITFNETIDECKKDPSIKLHSSASCGCRSNDLIVNSDITLRVTAQLGYSRQSVYLGISLWYKDILIHPYSFFVSNFREYRKYNFYIKNISPHIYCWDEIFQHTVDMANMAATYPEQFYNKYIKDELKKMVSGLRYIVDNPKHFIDSVMEDKDSYYMTGIRPEHVKTYRKFPDDMSMALIADKLCDAHKLFSNLTKLAKFEPIAQGAYNTITDFITRMLPIAKKYYETNNDAIERLSISISDAVSKLQELKRRLSIHTQHIDEIHKRGSEYLCVIEAKYERECYEYRYLKEEIKRTEQTYSNLLGLKFGRKLILESLKEFIDTVTKSNL